MRHSRNPRYTVEIEKPSGRRMAEIIQPGDHVVAFVRHCKVGFTGTLLVTAVHHWGVFAVMRGAEADKRSRHFIKPYYESLIKRQFKIKWHNIDKIICDAPDPDAPFAPKPAPRPVNPKASLQKAAPPASAGPLTAEIKGVPILSPEAILQMAEEDLEMYKDRLEPLYVDRYELKDTSGIEAFAAVVHTMSAVHNQLAYLGKKRIEAEKSRKE